MDAAGFFEGCRDGGERHAGQCLYREYLHLNEDEIQVEIPSLDDAMPMMVLEW